MSLKRRRISENMPQSGSSGGVADSTPTSSVEQRKRKWGQRKRDSSDSVATPTISTDVLKVIVSVACLSVFFEVS